MESCQPSGILTVYSAIYNDEDVGLLDPKETKEQVELYNEMNSKKKRNMIKKLWNKR